MSVKHVPTIALPWVQHEQGDANSYVLLKADGKTWVVAFLLNGEQTTEAQRQNAAYICHTANVYPELVEALREALANAPTPPSTYGLRAGNGCTELIKITETPEWVVNASALLTKLGEA